VKRPQFSLKLLLLITALVAVLAGWLRARWQLALEDRNFENTNVQTILELGSWGTADEDQIRQELRDAAEDLKRKVKWPLPPRPASLPLPSGEEHGDEEEGQIHEGGRTRG
jgi:hypothetical protein